MSEPKKPVTSVKTPVAMHYNYSVGAGTSTFLRAIRQGRIMGARCPDTGKVYVPPRLSSVETASPMSELVEVQINILLCSSQLGNYCFITVLWRCERCYIAGKVEANRIEICLTDTV